MYLLLFAQLMSMSVTLMLMIIHGLQQAMAMARSIVLGMLRQSQFCYDDGDKLQDSVKTFTL